VYIIGVTNNLKQNIIGNSCNYTET